MSQSTCQLRILRAQGADMNCKKQFDEDLETMGDFKVFHLEKLIQAYGFWEFARGYCECECKNPITESCARKRTDVSEQIYRQILEVIREEREKTNDSIALD